MTRSKITRFLASVLIALVVLSVLPVRSEAASSGIAAVTTAKLKLYKSPSTSAACYGSISKGKQITCIKVSGSWAYVQVGSYKGYVLKSGLTAKTTAAKKVSSSSSAASSSSGGTTCYIKTATRLYRRASTGSGSVCSLAVGKKILVTLVKGGWCYATTSDGRIGYVPTSAISKTQPKTITKIVLADWFDSNIQRVFKKGMNVVVTDVLTRKTFTVHRRGGHNHADCEPLTSADTATILGIYGGRTSWKRRAIWVTINGVTYAASMNFMNHGKQDITNNDFEGHFCIHFLNSRTHGSDLVDPDHQAAIMRAYRTKP